MMTSFGTGLRRPRALRSRWRFEPAALKAISALRAMIYDTQVQGIAMMQTLSRPQRGWLVNSEIDDMAGGPFVGAPVLDYQRIDVSLERRGAGRGDDTDIVEGGFLGIGAKRSQPAVVEALLGETLSAKALDDLDELANGDPANIDLLLRIGRATGVSFVSETYPNPVFDLPEWKAA
jgi:hypothetical protein